MNKLFLEKNPSALHVKNKCLCFRGRGDPPCSCSAPRHAALFLAEMKGDSFCTCERSFTWEQNLCSPNASPAPSGFHPPGRAGARGLAGAWRSEWPGGGAHRHRGALRPLPRWRAPFLPPLKPRGCPGAAEGSALPAPGGNRPRPARAARAPPEAATGRGRVTVEKGRGGKRRLSRELWEGIPGGCAREPGVGEKAEGSRASLCYWF